MADSLEMGQHTAQTTIQVIPPATSLLAQPLLGDSSRAGSVAGSALSDGDSANIREANRSWTSKRKSLSKAPSLHRHSSQSFSWKFKYEHLWDTQPDPEDATFGKGQKEFYRRQRATLEGYRQVDEISAHGPTTSGRRDEREARMRGEMRAVQLSNGANVVLFLGKLVAASMSGSLAVIASTLDSLLDLVAGAILWVTARSLRSPDKYKYPVGNQRMQPVGIIVFAAIMATLGAQVLLEAGRQLMAGNESDAKLGWYELAWVCAVFAVVVVAKFVLFLICRRYDDEIVQAYAQDHFFDVLTNSVSLGAVLLARHVTWWLDPVGAMAISLYTIVNWSLTVFQNAVSLVGMSAPPEFTAKVTYMALSHDPRIQHIDTIRAWTFGTLYMVEVDIELPQEMRLGEAHDIGESLQDKIEAIPEVDRAFVHLDYESHHTPEHAAALRGPHAV